VMWYDQVSQALLTQRTTATSFTIPGSQLTAGHEYSFAVDAVNQYGAGASGGAPSAIAGYGAPAATVLRTAKEVNLGSAALSWDKVVSAVDYQIWQRDWVNSGAWTALPLHVSSTTFNPGLLLNSYDYEFKITTFNGSLPGASSNILKVTPLPLTAPTLKAVAGKNQVTLTWNAVPNDDGYYWIWAADITAGQSMARLPYPTNQLTFTHSLLTSGHTYKYQVGGNEGPYTGPLSAAVTAKPS